MAKKNKKMYKHGGRAENENLHNLSQKEYDKAVGGGTTSYSYKHGGKFKLPASSGSRRPQHD